MFGRNERDAETWRLHRATTAMSGVAIPGRSVMSMNDCLLEFREAFDMFDHNGDNKISREELTQMMTRLGQMTSEDEITSIMKKADKDCT